MSFVAARFFFFLALFLAGASLLKGRSRVAFYTFFSYLFYAADYPPFVGLLFVSSAVDYWVGKRLFETAATSSRKRLLLLSLLTNLGLLSVFKYLGFFTEVLTQALHWSGLGLSLPVPQLRLPIGISFYSFQTMSYTIDMYRRKYAPAGSFLDFLCFVSFFPHLIAGPILRADQFLPQLSRHRVFVPDDVRRGTELVATGMFKKLVIADSCAIYADRVFNGPPGSPGAVAWLGTLCFAAQIYGDFSGYSDIARGLGRLLGLRIPVNFRWPYLSSSMREFWRRWHMTLSFWIRDYLYIPLGGSRVPKARRAFNIMVTWGLCGLWHGAAWNFVLWGAGHGLALLAEVSTRAGRSATTERERWRPLGWLVTMIIVLLLWVPFRAESVSAAVRMWREMLWPARPGWFSGLGVFGLKPWALLVGGGVLHALSYRFGYDVDRNSQLARLPYPLYVSGVAIVILILVVFAAEQRPFIYFAF